MKNFKDIILEKLKVTPKNTGEFKIQRISSAAPVVLTIMMSNIDFHMFDCENYITNVLDTDIVISSLHKTLPSLTQTAVVNVFNEKYADKVKRYMDIFQTTSPSYVLMDSIDICCDYVLNCRNEFGKFYEKLCDLRLVETDNLKIQYNDDISKIVLSCASTNITGSELAEIFRNKYKILYV